MKARVQGMIQQANVSRRMSIIILKARVPYRRNHHGLEAKEEEDGRGEREEMERGSGEEEKEEREDADKHLLNLELKKSSRAKGHKMYYLALTLK